MFLFLFILKLLITAFLINCSIFYMQDGLVSVFDFKVTFQRFSHGFLFCQLQVPVHPLSSGSVY